jgi:uncharacterized protein YjbI with pentapeptide repeats
LSGSIFEQVNYKNINLSFSTGLDARFSDAQLVGAKFRNAKLTQPDFSGANLNNAVLTGSSITLEDMDTANFCGALLRDGFYADSEDCENA